MKNRQLVLEHSDMMFHSRELVQLQLPVEINVLIYTIAGMFFFLGISLCIVKISDVKKVSGIIKTQENISTVKNILSGRIEQICYKPDQFVRKGDVLYSLEKEIYETEIKRLELDISNIDGKLLCINSLLDGINSGKNLVSMEKDLMTFSRLEEYFSTVGYYEEQIEIFEFRYLREKNKPEMLLNQQDMEEAWKNLCLSRKELERYKAGFFSELVQSKNEYEVEINKLNQDLKKLREEASFLEVKAPVDGFVQEISSLNAGDYIFADQSVLNIVPSDRNDFKVEMNVGTRDIGEIVPGMTVKYRLSAFPFFEYKGANGKILSIDSDIRKSSDGRLFYLVYADIDRISFTNNKGVDYPLRAGIEVDGRIVMEKISLLQFLLRKLDFVQ